MASAYLGRSGTRIVRHRPWCGQHRRVRCHLCPAKTPGRRGEGFRPYHRCGQYACRLARCRLELRAAAIRLLHGPTGILRPAQLHLRRLQPPLHQRYGLYRVFWPIPQKPARRDQQLFDCGWRHRPQGVVRHHPRPRLAHLSCRHPRQAGERQAVGHPCARHAIRPHARYV